MSRDFEGKVGACLVTGGSGALGAAVVRKLAERGCHVAFTYRSNEADAAGVAAEAEAHGVQVQALQLDLKDADATVEALDAVQRGFGAIHSIVYASGPFVPLVYLSRVSTEQFRHQVEADTVAFFNLLQPAIAHLRESRGNVVAVGTAATTRAIIRDGLSAGPKGAVEGLIRTLALEEGRFGVRANYVGVGMTSVGMAAELMDSGGLDAAGVTAAVANIPLRRFGEAQDIAEAVCFLASDAAGFITGQTLNVDGGYSA
jgi:3-oxoacyl-[acyl-carrier protein] reductase